VSLLIKLRVLIPLIIRLTTLTRSSCNLQYLGSDMAYSIWSLVAVHTSVIANTFSCVKHFLVSFDSGSFFGDASVGQEMDFEQQSYEMPSISSETSGRRSPKATTRRSVPSMLLESEGIFGNHTTIEGGQPERTGDSPIAQSFASHEAIISKTSRWDVLLK